MLTEAVIVALIAAIGSVIGQYFLSRKARREDDVKRAVLDERTANRLAAIERKLDEHNHYAEKLGDIQQDIAVIRTEIQQMKESNHD